MVLANGASSIDRMSLALLASGPPSILSFSSQRHVARSHVVPPPLLRNHGHCVGWVALGLIYGLDTLDAFIVVDTLGSTFQ